MELLLRTDRYVMYRYVNEEEFDQHKERMKEGHQLSIVGSDYKHRIVASYDFC